MSNRKFCLGLVALIALSAGAVWGLINHISKNPLSWPGKTLTYHDQSIWKASVRASVKKFNSTGLGIKLVEEKDPDKAQIRIVSDPKSHQDCGKKSIACATLVGYLPIPFYQPKIVLPSPHKLAGMDTIERTITHEFGHILGLKHQTEPCSVMARSNTRIECPAYRDMGELDINHSECEYHGNNLKCERLYRKNFWCGLKAHDLALLQERYGGQINPNYESRCRRKVLMVTHEKVEWPFSS